MAGTIEGGYRAAATNKERHGDDFYKRIGGRGGRSTAAEGTIKGFALNRELARSAGAKGGRISRRGKSKLPNFNISAKKWTALMADKPF